MKNRRKASDRPASDLQRWGNLCNALAEDAVHATRRKPETARGQSRLTPTAGPLFTVGQRVIIEKGPLSGIEGVLQEIKDSNRFIISLNLRMRPLVVEVEGDGVRPVAEAPDRILRGKTKRYTIPKQEVVKKGN
jgi:hypothetical protein